MIKKERLVFIKRKPYTRDPKFGKAPELIAQDKWSIGSSLTSTGAVYKGLSRTEENLLMPSILGLDSSDISFIPRSNEWFSSIKWIVPITDMKLNIALEDDSKPLSADNLPVVIEDYVKWRYISGGYNRVTSSLEELNGNKDALFYIYNPEIKEKQDNNIAMSKVEAMKEFTLIFEKEAVMDAILRVLTGRYTGQRAPLLNIANPEKMSKSAKQTILANFSTANPEEFLSAVKDESLEPRAEVYEFLTASVIEDTGGSYVFMNKELGKTIDHVIAFIKAPANQELYLHMKGKLDSGKRTPRVKDKTEKPVTEK